MYGKYKVRTNIGIGLGIALQLVGQIVFVYSEADLYFSGTVIALILFVLGTLLCVWGCFGYAKGKGYSGVLGLLGLASILGVIILMYFPDKTE